MSIPLIITNGLGNGTFSGSIAGVVLQGFESGAGDVTAPTLSSPTAVQTGTATSTGTVVTDEGNGTLFWVDTLTNDAPTADQVIARQDYLGAAAPGSNNKAITASGIQTSLTTSGLSDTTTYYRHYAHRDAALNKSAVVTTSAYTTDAPAAAASEEVVPGFISRFWWDAFDDERKKQELIKKKREEKLKKVEKLQSNIDQKLAKQLQKDEIERERLQELNRLTDLADQYKKAIEKEADIRLQMVINRAIEKRTYSAMEAMERELKKAREEEDFLSQAINLILNQ